MSTILVVEDSAIVRQPIEAALENSGYETRSAENGVEGLQQAAECSPDLILLDLALPEMDGIAMLKALRESEHAAGKPPVPVIILTAVAEKAQVLAAVQLGISGYLLKSRFSLKELLEIIRKTLSAGPTEASADCPPGITDTNETNATVVTEEAPSPISHPVQVATECNQTSEDAHDLSSLKPLLTRSQVTEHLDACAEMKGLSPAVSQVLKLTGNNRCSIEQVARAISQDHAIALKVLKLANSAVYTRGEPVDSVQLAVSRIGLGQIRQTVLNISVIDQFSVKSGPIDFGQFWEHAVATGVIAAEITRRRNDGSEKDVDAAFTMGLLHDVGRMYFAEQFSDEYAKVVETASQLQLPMEQVESRMLLLNHADIMDRVLHSWKFPKQLINPIVYHHLSAGNIRRNAPRQIEEVAALGLANRLAHALMLGSSGNEAIYPTEDLCQLLKLEPDVLDALAAPVDGVRDESDKVKFALLMNSPGGVNWPQLRQVHRDELREPLRPLYVSMSPHYDGVRIFIEQMHDDLRASSDDSMPNLGVMHIASARDRVALTTAYKAAEHDAGVSGLPLLILSPAGKLLPENSLLSGRQYEQLATPFVISRFVAAVNRLIGASQRRANAA